jgi:hypothetical protein
VYIARKSTTGAGPFYDTLDPDVAEWLKANKPPSGLRWHQQLTENFGARKLVSHCYEIIGMGKTCTTIREGCSSLRQGTDAVDDVSSEARCAE